MAIRILAVEDDESFVNALRLMLRSHSIEVVWAATGADGIRVYRQNPHNFATIILDYNLPDLKGSEVAIQIRKINPIQDILFASGHREPEYLMDMLETGGARSFIAKGRPVAETRSKILESISVYERKNRVVGLDDYSPSKAEQELKTAGFIGRSAALYSVLEKVRLLRDSEDWTFLIGESGVGKEVVARSLVPKGKRFLAISCAAFTGNEQRLEADLFGYVKSAFTGANQDTPGLFATAHEQVLFLDELHTLSIAAQAKLLRVLQEMKYQRFGDHTGREYTVRFKLITAVQPDIGERMRDGRFLEDLYQRVGKFKIPIPALRDRPEDIEPLVRYCQNNFNLNKPLSAQKQIRASTIERMEKYEWSGNVRELMNAVEHMLKMTQGDIINPSAFDSYLDIESKTKGTPPSLPKQPITQATEQFEFEQVVGVLKRSKTLVEASLKLGLSRYQLYRSMIRLGINPDAYLIGAT